MTAAIINYKNTTLQINFKEIVISEDQNWDNAALGLHYYLSELIASTVEMGHIGYERHSNQLYLFNDGLFKSFMPDIISENKYRDKFNKLKLSFDKIQQNKAFL